LTHMKTDPPDNWRSFDNSLIVVETGGLRILHWGDNRPNPPERVWAAIGQVDVALLPIDGSEHVMSYGQVEAVIERLKPRITVPHHY
ncbi:MBL fold metallo-hydrolase, partial [Acinetobacter baumannii]